MHRASVPDVVVFPDPPLPAIPMIMARSVVGLLDVLGMEWPGTLSDPTGKRCQMCLGIPGRLVERFEKHGARFGLIDFDGITKEVCLEYLPELQIGEYCIVHVGFAISQLDEKEAMESLELMRSLGVLAEELDPAEAERLAALQGGDDSGP